MVQWLRLCIPSAGGLGSILGQGTKSHTRYASVKTKDPTCHTETQHSQINKYIFKKERFVDFEFC